MLQEKVAGHGLDTRHFAKRSPWHKYPDTAIAEAATSSSSLREVALKLGATPATGTLSHIRRRIDAAGIDISHFPGANRADVDLPFTPEELRAAAAEATSVRGVARALGVPDDSRSRATLSHMLRTHDISPNRAQLHRALNETGVPYACESCANTGEWLSRPITLQIDHINGDWRDNRRENVRYLCPNCHALTETWCHKKGRVPLAG